MAKTEEEALDELLRQDPNPAFYRWATWAAAVITLGVVLMLMYQTMKQIAQTDRDAFDAHQREVRVQRALDSARQVQAISAEQFLSFGSSARVRNARACTPQTLDDQSCINEIDRIVGDFAQGRFLPINDVRQLREVATVPGGPASRSALASVILDANSLERWIAPMADSAESLMDDPLFRLTKRTIPDEGGDPWLRVRQRLDTIILGAGGANQGTCAVCTELLWGNDPSALPEDAEPRFVDPGQSFDIAVWQAECLRKLPTLANPRYAFCQTDDTVPARRTELARDKGRKAAEERFRAATEWFESQATDGSHKVCGVLETEPGQPAGVRTVAVIAGRAYNGLAMSLINHAGEVTALELQEAEKAIERAVCFRTESQQTRSQVAGSAENLAVIAYRDAWQSHKSGDEERAAEAFNEAKCRAEAAVHDNVNLAWSWTILYLTYTAKRAVFQDQPSCGKVTGRPEAEVGGQGRTLDRLRRRLSFFPRGSFAPEELPGLLPMFPSGPFNQTGYSDLRELLRAIDESHQTLVSGEDDPLNVFMTSVTGPGGMLSFGN